MSSPLVGVVLAGGAGRRLGGGKPGALLGGRPLVAWVVAALTEVVGSVAVVAKQATVLPALGARVAVWREPDEPVHPLAGVVWALRCARGQPVLVCPVDVPFVSAVSLRALMAAPGEVAVADGQPLLGRFSSAAGPGLEEAVRAGRSVQATVAALDATVVAVAPGELFNVNTPEDLAAAQSRAITGPAASGA